VSVTIKYANLVEYHTISFSTQTDWTALRVQILKSNGKSVGYPLLRTFVEFGEHPRSAWKVSSMISTGLNPNFNCNLSGDFFLAMHLCKNPLCN